MPPPRRSAACAAHDLALATRRQRMAVHVLLGGVAPHLLHRVPVPRQHARPLHLDEQIPGRVARVSLEF
jgi:hypothetical protein